MESSDPENKKIHTKDNATTISTRFVQQILEEKRSFKAFIMILQKSLFNTVFIAPII